MRDSFDDEPPVGGEYGKLISGVFSDDPDSVSPAEYALPPGVPALMDESLECERSSRRRFVLGIGGLIAVSAAGGVVGGYLVSRSAARAGAPAGPLPDTKLPGSADALSAQDVVVLRGARAMARGPVSELTRYHVAFLNSVIKFKDDPVLWEGVETLMRVAMIDSSREGYDIARLILEVIQDDRYPQRVAPLVRSLRDRVAASRDRDMPVFRDGK